jgi:hypothetical protein
MRIQRRHSGIEPDHAEYSGIEPDHTVTTLLNNVVLRVSGLVSIDYLSHYVVLQVRHQGCYRIELYTPSHLDIVRETESIIMSGFAKVATN